MYTIHLNNNVHNKYLIWALECSTWGPPWALFCKHQDSTCILQELNIISQGLNLHLESTQHHCLRIQPAYPIVNTSIEGLNQLGRLGRLCNFIVCLPVFMDLHVVELTTKMCMINLRYAYCIIICLTNKIWLFQFI